MKNYQKHIIKNERTRMRKLIRQILEFKSLGEEHKDMIKTNCLRNFAGTERTCIIHKKKKQNIRTKEIKYMVYNLNTKEGSEKETHTRAGCTE